ncbi:MAG: P1 family peptidase, partial [Siculibacillus sp.]
RNGTAAQVLLDTAQDLGAPGYVSSANAVDATGAIVVGQSQPIGGGARAGSPVAAPGEVQGAFYWTAAAGMQSLSGLLSSAGVAMTGTATTIGIVATDAVLTKTDAKRLAIQAHDGLARAVWPAHTPLDGDLLFALSTGRRPLENGLADRVALGIAAVSVVARAIARGVHAAKPMEWSPEPAWCELPGARLTPPRA